MQGVWGTPALPEHPSCPMAGALQQRVDPPESLGWLRVGQVAAAWELPCCLLP